jgi:hypothetical protein
MAKHIAFLSCVLLATIGCEESVTAPGACPDFCKDATFEVLDSILTDVVVRDSSFRGFVFSHRSRALQLVRQPAGTETRGILNFVEFQPRVPTFPGDTVFGDVVSVDSFVVQLSVIRRNEGVSGVSIGMHRIPTDLDSTTSYGSLDAFFDDSTSLGTIDVPDSLVSGEVFLTLGSGAFLTQPDDTVDVSLGLDIATTQPAFLTLGTGLASSLASVRRFLTVDSSGTQVSRDDSRIAIFTRAVPSLTQVVGTNELAIGGMPSSRTVLRVDGVEEILTGSSVIRATLEFTPSVPTVAAPGDSILVQVNPVGVDFGRKSPLVFTQLDTLSRGTITVPGGSTEPFEVDITTIVRAWAANSELPRTLIMTVIPEAATIGEVRVFSSGGAQPPSLRLTFVPPLGLSN